MKPIEPDDQLQWIITWIGWTVSFIRHVISGIKFICFQSVFSMRLCTWWNCNCKCSYDLYQSERGTEITFEECLLSFLPLRWKRWNCLCEIVHCMYMFCCALIQMVKAKHSYENQLLLWTEYFVLTVLFTDYSISSKWLCNHVEASTVSIDSCPPTIQTIGSCPVLRGPAAIRRNGSRLSRVPSYQLCIMAFNGVVRLLILVSCHLSLSLSPPSFLSFFRFFFHPPTRIFSRMRLS